MDVVLLNYERKKYVMCFFSPARYPYPFLLVVLSDRRRRGARMTPCLLLEAHHPPGLQRAETHITLFFGFRLLDFIFETEESPFYPSRCLHRPFSPQRGQPRSVLVLQCSQQLPPALLLAPGPLADGWLSIGLSLGGFLNDLVNSQAREGVGKW